MLNGRTPISSIPDLLPESPHTRALNAPYDRALYVVPPPPNLKARHWDTVSVHTFTRLAGESIIRIPYVRLVLARSAQPSRVKIRVDGGPAKEFVFRTNAVALVPNNMTTQVMIGETEIVHIIHNTEIYRQAALEIGNGAAIDLEFVPDLGDSHIVEIALMLAHEVEGPGCGERMLVEGLSAALAVRVLRRLAGIKLPHPGGLSPERLAKVVEFIDAHLANSELSLQQLSALVCLSAYQFGRAFKHATGETPHQFVLTRRIDYAKTLLRERRLSLCAVASAAGFADQAHFSTRFRQSVGVTPRQYRLAAA